MTDNGTMKKIMKKFLGKLEKEVKKKPHSFFLEEDLRSYAYMEIYKLLKQNNLLNARTEKKEIRLRANYNPYSYHKTPKYNNLNVAYDLAVLDEEANDALCIIEFKFNKRYIGVDRTRFRDKTMKYGNANIKLFKRDYKKIEKQTAKLKYSIFIDLGWQTNGVKEYTESLKNDHNVKVVYLCNDKMR
ncbi:MAG: hypothetical protein ACP5NX_02335 [Candidatus Bilamarchaeaceae archaeon]